MSDYTPVLWLALIVISGGAVGLAVLCHAQRQRFEEGQIKDTQIRLLRDDLRRVGLLPSGADPIELPPIVAVSQQLKGLELLLQNAETAGLLEDLRKRIEDIERLRAAGPTTVLLAEQDQQRLDELATLIQNLNRAIDESRERAFHLAYLSAGLQTTNEALASNLTTLTRLTEAERPTTEAELARLRAELGAMSERIGGLIKVIRDELIPALSVERDERPPMRLVGNR